MRRVELATRFFLIRPPSREEPRGEAVIRAQGILEPLLARLAARRTALVVGSPHEPGLSELAGRLGAPLRCDPRLHPVDAALPAEGGERVLGVLDDLSREFQQAEIVVFLHAEGIRAVLARALHVADASVFAPEPAQAIALDWAHPQARDFKHALIGFAFDWDVAPVSKQVHRFPGGASVLPRSS